MTWRDKYLNEVVCGHALDLLPEIPDGVFHCAVTSPPYWNLRDYKAPAVVWGGNDCEHVWVDKSYARRSNDSGEEGRKQTTNIGAIGRDEPVKSDFCGRCGAWRGQLGLEPTPELYVQHIVEVCREIKRVLRDDGSFWLNLGDSYATSSPGTGNMKPVTWIENGKEKKRGMTRAGCPPGLKPKDLVGIPWTVAFALRDDGWYLRRDIIWEKPNPMPESCRDRPTSAHEYVFLLTKSGTAKYWTHRDFNGTRRHPAPDYRYAHVTGYEVVDEPPGWAASIITCPFCEGTGEREVPAEGLFEGMTFKVRCEICDNPEPDEEDDRPKPRAGQVYEWKRVNLWRGHDYFYDQEATREPHKPESLERVKNRFYTADQVPGRKVNSRPDGDMSEFCHPAGRNLRSVWNIATAPFSGAHFATFPPELARRCILTSPTKVCKECGAGWERVVDRKLIQDGPVRNRGKIKGGDAEAKSMTMGDKGIIGHYDVKTLGFRPTCDCDAGADKAIILDPFMGSGTVALVAHENFRYYVGLEINPDYITLADKRGLKQEVIF